MNQAEVSGDDSARIFWHPMKERDGRFRWTAAVLGVLLVAGGYVDAWVRLQPRNPIAPWQDAPVDTVWLLLTGFIALVFGRNLAEGKSWRAALPPGYHLAMAGGLVFGLAAIANVYYEFVFGVGQGLEALLAPPHLAELAGGGLLVAAPLTEALRQRPERVGWPVVLSAASTLSALTFLTQFIHPLVDLWPARAWPIAPVAPIWVSQHLGVAAILVQVSLLVGVMLLLIRSFALPVGSLTVICTLNALCLQIAGGHPELVAVSLLTGLAADALLIGLRPDSDQPARLRAFSALVPALYTLLYAGAIVLFEGGSLWSPQLWAGVLLAAGLAGFLVSYLAGIRRPRSLVAQEVWQEIWPQRHVEVTPASVKEALECLDDLGALQSNPLVRLPCITSDGRGAGDELRRLLVDIAHELASAKAPRDAEAGRLLVEYYVKQVGSHEVIAERLHLSRPTFYRRLQRGLALTAERLDELAEFAARHRSPESEWL